ncbi:MAG: hypothetical protein HRT70_09565 [Flavobacteriaceae bacterium]|nr:hypothetical protein [Flavobacteriaceae bacterium]
MSNSDEPMLVKQLHKKVVYWQNKYKELEERVLELQANRYAVALLYTKQGYSKTDIAVRLLMTSKNSEEEALGAAINEFKDEMKGFTLDVDVVLKAFHPDAVELPEPPKTKTK